MCRQSRRLTADITVHTFNNYPSFAGSAVRHSAKPVHSGMYPTQVMFKFVDISGLVARPKSVSGTLGLNISGPRNSGCSKQSELRTLLIASLAKASGTRCPPLHKPPSAIMANYGRDPHRNRAPAGKQSSHHSLPGQHNLSIRKSYIQIE